MGFRAIVLAGVISSFAGLAACSPLEVRQNTVSPAANSTLPKGWSYIGCYNESNPRVLSQGGYNNNTMTGGQCTAYCNSKNFVYGATEYGQECYCGNQLSAATSLQNDTKCAMSCAGKSSEACGGPNFLTVYFANKNGPAVNPGPPGWKSYGCWADGNPRTLSVATAMPGGFSNATVSLCTSACSGAGYSLAGVEYAGECYCDNYVSNTAVQAVSTDCNMPCNGNASEFCGAGNRLNLYAAGNTKPSTRPNMTLPTGWTSMGCYSDNVGGRTLGFGTQVPGGANNMTNGNCLQACQKAGYTLAGTEYAAECYCDNSIQAGGGPASDGNAQCNMPCKGDSGQICGGPNRLNLYSFGSKSASSSKSSTTSAKSTGATTSSIASTTSTTPANSPTSVAPTTTAPATTTTSAAPTTTPATTTSVPATSTTSTTSASAQPTVNGFKYQGCYTDTNSTGRSLTYQFPDSQTNTVPSCISQCSGKGYTIAGLQYGTQCFCDNYVANSPQLRPDSECNMACSGDATQKCGAGGRNSIYSSGPLGPRTPPGPLTGSALPTGWNYTGCLKDNINNMRSLPYFMNFPSNNSNTMCINLCQQFGFSVAGTEYGAQCFCGDTQNYLDAGATFMPDTQCANRCSNDTAGSNGGEICGGQNAISLYTWSTPLNKWSFATGNAAGRFDNTAQGPVIPLITAPSRNGKVTFVEKFGTSQTQGSTGAYEYDPSTSTFRTLHVKTDVFCAASLTMPDRAGRQINIGGWSAPSTAGIRLYWPDGSPGVAGTNDWQENVNTLALQAGRWYPSAMTLANGSVMVMGGEDGSNGKPVPSLELLPRTGPLLQCDYLQRTDPNNLYPFMIVLPSGRIFIGYYNEALLLDPGSLQPVLQLPNMPGSVDRPDSGRTYPFEGAAMVMPQVAPYTDPLQILICGGSNPGAAVGLDNCITIAPDQPNAKWQMERMPSRRVMPYVAALPDGTYLITGGARQGVAGFGLATDPNLSAVLYDPTKPFGQRMTVMANTTIARLYHSQAVLLDDGRVLISGSDPEDGKNPQEYRNEYFIPPYLTSGAPRPAFTSPDLDWAYGSSHTLQVSSMGSGGKMRVSAMGAVASTHGNSMGQRTFFLATSCNGNTCTITAPPNANVCPPAWFQIFLLDSAGTPSTATWVRIGGDPGQLGNWPSGDPSFKVPGMGAPQKLF